MPAHLMAELETISSAVDLLQPLSPDARSRVLAWLDDYFMHHANVTDSTVITHESTTTSDENAIFEESVIATTSTEGNNIADVEGNDSSSDENYEETFDSFEQFYDYVSPKTARQKVATAGWWLEFEEGKSSWRTFDVTKALKNIGRPLRYLSTTITQEKKKDDPLIEQLSKDGDSAQAHGTFRLSEFGRAFVEGHLPEDYLTSIEDAAYSDEESAVDFSDDIDETVVETEEIQEHNDDQGEYVEF